MPRTPPRTASAWLRAPLLSLLAAAGLVSAQSPAPAPQQPAPPAPPAPSAQTVRLGLIVTDKAGRAVADVRQEDLIVSEDGAPQAVTYFAREESPVSYGVVVDNSGSMRPLMGVAVHAGATLVGGNRPGDETFVVRFVTSERIELLQGFTDDRRALLGALSSMYVEGGQSAVIDAVHLAVRHAAEQRKGAAGRRLAVVLVSDCEDRSSVFKQSELIALLRAEGVQVFVIAFLEQLSGEPLLTRASAKERARKLAQAIADESGGRAFFPKKAGDLASAADEISRDLRAQYVFGYTPTNARADGKFRKVEVKLADAPGRDGHTARARPGYHAPGAAAEEKGQKK